jgi:hypothetical protein
VCWSFHVTASAPNSRTRIAAAYECAAGQIELARTLVANGAEVDLAPIRPAIRDLCDVLKSIPKNEAAEWLAQLIELQHELARLGQEFVARAGNGQGPRVVIGEPDE